MAEIFAKESLMPRNTIKVLWKKCAAFGLFNKIVPKEYGGEELDELSFAILLEGFGKGCSDSGLILALSAHLWGVQYPLQRLGSKLLKEKYLKKLATGELIGALAITEEKSGSDISSIETFVIKQDNNYILNGKKIFITNGPTAGLFVVFAKFKDSLIALFVESSTKGIHIGKAQQKMGLDTAPLGSINFENCVVPIENRFGAEGIGKILFNKTMEIERTFILTAHIGVMERIIDETIKYSLKRKQFGKKISEFQSISNRIVEMKIKLETARLLMYKTAWLQSKKKEISLEASMLKLYLSESYLFICDQALRIRGGYGYLTESKIEEEVRNAYGSIFYSGTSDIQRVIISKAMGL
jgi:alkylation response protein AidB-like acyl-CoA dehydrogenase